MNVNHRRCAHQDCASLPSYGADDGNQKAEYFSQHAQTLDWWTSPASNVLAWGAPRNRHHGVDDGESKSELLSAFQGRVVFTKVAPRSRRTVWIAAARRPSTAPTTRRVEWRKSSANGVPNQGCATRSPSGTHRAPYPRMSALNTPSRKRSVHRRATGRPAAERQREGVAIAVWPREPTPAHLVRQQRGRNHFFSGEAARRVGPSRSSEETSSKKRARLVDVPPALGVPIKKEDEKLAGEASGSSSGFCPAQGTGRITLRSVPLTRSVAGEKTRH